MTTDTDIQDVAGVTEVPPVKAGRPAPNGRRAATGAAPAGLVIPLDIQIEEIILPIYGTSPLIVHRWSEKAKEAIRLKTQGGATQKKAPKNPHEEYRSSMYILDDQGDGVERYGFRSVGFKAAAVSAGRYADAKMTYLRGAFHVPGELVEIHGEPRMREDAVRLNGLTTDLRYRAEFPEWWAHVPIRYNTRAITTEQLVGLFRLAGFSIGVGEWRPERDGQYGTFDVGEPPWLIV